MIVTNAWLEKYKSPRGGYFACQIKALGFTWPPKKGWKKRILNKEITEQQRSIFEAGAISKNESRQIARNANVSNYAIAEELKKPKLRKQKIHAATSDDFLQTYKWRRLRMEAIKKYGAKCQCCGATPATGAVINVDHIKPRKLFPQLALSLDNLQVLCHECNHGKGNWDMTDWRPDSEYENAQESYVFQLPNI